MSSSWRTLSFPKIGYGSKGRSNTSEITIEAGYGCSVGDQACRKERWMRVPVPEDTNRSRSTLYTTSVTIKFCYSLTTSRA